LKFYNIRCSSVYYVYICVCVAMFSETTEAVCPSHNKYTRLSLRPVSFSSLFTTPFLPSGPPRPPQLRPQPQPPPPPPVRPLAPTPCGRRPVLTRVGAAVTATATGPVRATDTSAAAVSRASFGFPAGGTFFYFRVLIFVFRISGGIRLRCTSIGVTVFHLRGEKTFFGVVELHTIRTR